MSLYDEFKDKLFFITAFKYLDIQNREIMNLLNLQHIKSRTFSIYLMRLKDEIQIIQNLNIEFFKELKDDFLKHRKSALILEKINSHILIEYESEIPKDKEKKKDTSPPKKVEAKEEIIDHEESEQGADKITAPLTSSDLSDLLSSTRKTSRLDQVRQRKKLNI